MCKYKVSIYLKSGNIIYTRIKQRSKYFHLFILFYQNSPEEFFKLFTYAPVVNIDFEQVEAIIIKKWWQRWG